MKVTLRTLVVTTLGVVATAAIAAAYGISGSDAAQLGGIAFATGAGVLAFGLLVLRLGGSEAGWLIRSRAITVAVIPTVAMFVGACVAGRAMFVSDDDLESLVLIIVGSGTSGVLGAMALADRLVRARREVEAAQLRQSELEHSRRELIAWISHDLRTPIAGIRAMTEALTDGVVDDAATVARYHESLLTESVRLGALVDDLFELSTLQAEPSAIRTELISLGEIVSAATATATPRATAAGVELRCAISHEDDIELELGHREIDRVIHNLLENAIRHTPAGRTVEIALEHGDGDVSISVRDRCGGIAPQDLERIFDTGFRGDPARSGAGGGLGLTIARALVEGHHGRLEVENRDDGCVFRVSLPAPARSTRPSSSQAQGKELAAISPASL